MNQDEFPLGDPGARHAIVREVCLGGPEALLRHASEDVERDSDTALGLTLLRASVAPDLAIDVVETCELPGDRVFARLRIRRGGNPRTWWAVQMFSFRGSEIAKVWGVQDSLALMQSLGVVPDDNDLASRLDELTI